MNRAERRRKQQENARALRTYTEEEANEYNAVRELKNAFFDQRTNELQQRLDELNAENEQRLQRREQENASMLEAMTNAVANLPKTSTD